MFLGWDQSLAVGFPVESTTAFALHTYRVSNSRFTETQRASLAAVALPQWDVAGWLSDDSTKQSPPVTGIMFA